MPTLPTYKTAIHAESLADSYSLFNERIHSRKHYSKVHVTSTNITGNMFIKSIFMAGTVISLAAAIPLQQNHKRDVVWVTQTEVDYVTSQVWTTVYPGQSAAPHMPHGHGHAHHHKSQVTSHIMSTITVQGSAPAGPSAPVGSSVPPPMSSGGSIPPPMSSGLAPQMSQPAPSAPAPSSPGTSAPAPSSPAPAAPSSAGHKKPHKSHGGSGGGGGSAPSGDVHTGDITYYAPGLGSCGITSSSSEAIVALPNALMLAADPPNPNDNPYCGKTITISHAGTTAQATVVDTCAGCSGDSIDLSPTLFSTFAKLSVGRVSGVEWWFN